MKIEKNYPLKSLNTFGVDAKAKYFASIKKDGDLKKIVQTDEFENNRIFILGGGSNVLFTKDFDGLILSSDIKGMRIVESTDESITLEVGAGELWHKFVQTCVKSKYYGAENLALIPGKVGAAPVQNIGAYGVEQKDLFVSLKGFNLAKKKFETLDKNECAFGYRDSIFKKELKNKFIVASVNYELSRKEKLNLEYKGLADEIKKFPWVKPNAQYVFDAVCRLRRKKLPNLEKIGNAGSFFKNPIVSEEKLKALTETHPEINSRKIYGKQYKISAGWLIEKAGWKGKRSGDVGVYDKHALILVNHGDASGKDIVDFSEQIQNSIYEIFGIKLEPEVIIL